MNFSFLLFVSSLLIAAFAIPLERVKRGGYGRPSGYGANSYGNGGDFEQQAGFDGSFNGENINRFSNSNFNSGGFQNGGFNRVKRGGYGRPSGYGNPSYGNGGFDNQGGFDGGFSNGGFNQFPNNGGFQNGGNFDNGFQNGGFNG